MRIRRDCLKRGGREGGERGREGGEREKRGRREGEERGEERERGEKVPFVCVVHVVWFARSEGYVGERKKSLAKTGDVEKEGKQKRTLKLISICLSVALRSSLLSYPFSLSLCLCLCLFFSLVSSSSTSPAPPLPTFENELTSVVQVPLVKFFA